MQLFSQFHRKGSCYIALFRTTRLNWKSDNFTSQITWVASFTEGIRLQIWGIVFEIWDVLTQMICKWWCHSFPYMLLRVKLCCCLFKGSLKELIDGIWLTQFDVLLPKCFSFLDLYMKFTQNVTNKCYTYKNTKVSKEI